jgi:hypothetical protein
VDERRDGTRRLYRAMVFARAYDRSNLHAHLLDILDALGDGLGLCHVDPEAIRARQRLPAQLEQDAFVFQIRHFASSLTPALS